jgi:cysteine desulfurase
MSDVIYLDNNATTPIDPAVLEAMMPFLTTNFANANSTHRFGLDAYEAVKAARKQVAELIGAETNEIVFTSGATEAINLAIKGIAEAYVSKGKHIVTVQTEHHAVLDTCKYLEEKGFEVTYLPVQSDGLLDLDVFKNSLRSDTLLVSVMYVNNETGVIQPIQELAKITHDNGSLFITDATQAVGKLPIDVVKDDIDLLCFSGHKFYAPKGIGGLYVRQRRPTRIKIPALLHGGGQEKGLRSGTLNVAGIVALGEAAELAKSRMAADQKNVLTLRNELETFLLELPGTNLVGNGVVRLYNTTNIHFRGIDSDALIMALSDNADDTLIAVSNGSACTAASIEPSHVLMAMGLTEREAFCCIRFSLGRFNTKQEIEACKVEIGLKLEKIKQMIAS